MPPMIGPTIRASSSLEDDCREVNKINLKNEDGKLRQ